MASLNINIPHELEKEEALKRIQSLLQKIEMQYADKIKDLKQEWNGDTGAFSFQAMSFPVSGTLSVRDTEVVLDGELPFAASFFKGTIKSVIMDEAQKVLKK
jgi:hypothetical protein